MFVAYAWFWVALASVVFSAALTVCVHFMKRHPESERRLSALASAGADAPSTRRAHRPFRVANFLFYVLPRAAYLRATTDTGNSATAAPPTPAC